MAYDRSHIYWTFHWKMLTSGTTEEGQIGLRGGTPGTPPTLTTVTNVGDAFQAFWIHTSNGPGPNYSFYRVKAALVRPDGKYDPLFDPTVNDRTPTAGGGSATVQAAQIASATSLVTSRTSGRAYLGRVYLPPINGALLSTQLYADAAAAGRNTAFADFLTAMKAATGEEIYVMSSIGAGTTNVVTGVKTGRRPDVQRRRAAGIREVYSAVDAV